MIEAHRQHVMIQSLIGFSQLEKFEEAVIGRELKMIELEKEIGRMRKAEEEMREMIIKAGKESVR